MKPLNRSWPGSFPGAGRQAGATLIEALISLALSLVVVTSMVGLMSNSLGSATRIIEMSQLTDELRNAMSMMSRDVRRANYNVNSIYCYANSDCGTDGSATQAADIIVNNSNDCFIFSVERPRDDPLIDQDGGGFRRVVNGGVGSIEMWIGGSAPSCAADDNDWVAVTDPDFIDVTEFNVDDSLSFTQDYTEEGGATLTQRTRRLLLQLEGRLILDNRITRRIEDTIKVRNDYFL